MPKKRINLLAVIGEEESTKDLVKFSGIVGLGFEANVTFLAVNPASRQEFQIHTNLAEAILSEWEMEGIATRKLGEVEKWLVEYGMVLADKEGKALPVFPLHRQKNGALEKELKGIDCQTFTLKLRHGNLGEEVVLETLEKHYEMVFIGVPKSWKHIYKVMQFAAPPLMVVKRWTEKEYKFLVCLDGSPPSWKALRLGARLAKVLVAPLEIMSVAGKGLPEERAGEILSKAKAFLERISMPHKTALEKGEFQAKALEKASPNTILTIGRSRRSQVWQLIMRASPYRLATNAKGPVLVVK